MRLIYFIFSLLFSIYISQNIITSWNYDKVAMYDMQRIKTFLTSAFETPFDIYISIAKDTLIIDNIKLTQIQTNLYDSLINYNTGLLLFSPNKMTIYFNFSYTDSAKGYKGDSILELKILTFKLKVKNDKKSEKTNFSIKMSTTKENYIISGIEDKEFLNSLIDIFYQEFNNKLVLSNIIPEKMEKDLGNYYIEFYKKYKEFKVETNDFFGKMIFPMRNDKYMYFCEDLLGEYKTAFCYYSGYTSLYEDIKDKTKVPLKNERFSHNNDDLYNIFINQDMIKTIIDYISSNYFAYTPKYYNDKTNTKELSYKFNVESLQKYFIGLENFNKEDVFECEVYIENATLTDAIYKVKIKIKNPNYDYFIMRVTSDLTIDIPIIKSVRFNLCLKDIKTRNIEIIPSTINPQVKISDLEGLKKVIEESFDFNYNPICLNDNGISLKDYFSEINKVYIENEGIYIEGNHLYQ